MIELENLMDTVHAMLGAFTERFDDVEREANVNDVESTTPLFGLCLLRDSGFLLAPFPADYGGIGLGTQPEVALATDVAFRKIGSANLSLARLFEAHVNVIKLVVHYGTTTQIARLADQVARGSLLGLWVTDYQHEVRAIEREGGSFALVGSKAPASGVGVVHHAMITVTMPDRSVRMMITDVRKEANFCTGFGHLTGMRGAVSRGFCFDHLEVAESDMIGVAGDYMREPVFSSGAWRGSSGALGATERLAELFFAQLKARGRQGSPHQLTRAGKILITIEAARTWVRKAALAAEGRTAASADVVATVGLARACVEDAGLEVILAVQRGLGLSALVTTNPVERIMRDLSTYLRQPVPDEVLTEAAAHFLTYERPLEQLT